MKSLDDFFDLHTMTWLFFFILFLNFIMKFVIFMNVFIYSMHKYIIYIYFFLYSCMLSMHKDFILSTYNIKFHQHRLCCSKVFTILSTNVWHPWVSFSERSQIQDLPTIHSEHTKINVPLKSKSVIIVIGLNVIGLNVIFQSNFIERNVCKMLQMHSRVNTHIRKRSKAVDSVRYTYESICIL